MRLPMQPRRERVRMASMVRQQARLELGDDYDNVVRQCLGYLRYLLSRGWFNKGHVVAGEGGSANMLDALLARVVATGDVGTAVRDYGSYIASEYDQRREHNRMVSLSSLADYTKERSDASDPTDESWIEIKNTPLAQELQVADSAFLVAESPPASAGFQLEEGEGERFLDDEERELFTTIASVGGSKAEAGRVLGWPHDRTMRVFRRVRMRAARRPYPRGVHPDPL